MHIKRYEAATLEEAIARVKQELGPDALVLSTRRVRRDGGVFGWFGRPIVELVAGVDREHLRPAAAPPAPAARPAPEREMREPHPSWRDLGITQALLEPLEAELRALRRAVDGMQAPDAPRAGAALRAEIAELRREIERLAPKASPRKDPLVDRMLAAGFDVPHARSLVAEARVRAESNGDARAALQGVLARRLDARLAPPREDRAAPVTLVVGACGAGKTTTVAKLAGRADAELGIVTTDVHRLGGVEPLRALATQQGIGFATAASTDEVIERIRKLRARRILVDTAGIGRDEPGAVAELARLRERLGARARVELVVSATTKADDLRAELRRFAPLGPDALVATRVDDAESLVSVGNLLLDDGAPPLEWLGVGRRVPDDLAIPEPGALASRMLGVAA
ncbi:MAG: hypothetical protein DCC71_12310 [Proteobacteria bacterium]|nr:MAG: hypothetical protein DCC71_12310 [Pseudomonadota bacterium]